MNQLTILSKEFIKPQEAFVTDSRGGGGGGGGGGLIGLNKGYATRFSKILTISQTKADFVWLLSDLAATAIPV